MSFPRYPDYKDSGVEWLGEVPGHWATPPLYLRYSVELGKMLDSSRITGDHLVPYLRNVDVQWGRINFDDLPEMDIEESEYGRYTVAPGDLLVCEGGEVGRAAIVPERSGTIGFQKALHRLRALADDEHPAFMYFVLSWAALRGVFSQSGLSTIAHLTGEQLRKYRFPKPPIPEQVQIAAFLDRETGKIDTLVAEQQNLIALLKEKRQALISHAVMKGLDPDVRMKDSGMAWLGEVPAHWRVCSLRRAIAKIEQGWSPDCHARPAEAGEWGVLKAGCVNGGKYRPTENKALPSELLPDESYCVEVGDVLMSRASGSPDLVGSTALVRETPGRLMLSDKIFRLRLEIDVDPAFFVAMLNARALRAQIEQALSGGNGLANNLPQSNLLAFVCALPPEEEQIAIAARLNRDIEGLDQLMAEAESTISLLIERRTALISAAVTGKIDVRHLAVASADRTPEPA